MTLNRKAFFKSLLAAFGLAALPAANKLEPISVDEVLVIPKTRCIQEFIASEDNLPEEKEIRVALDFYRGNQWEWSQMRTRLAAGRPCIVVNRLPQYAHEFERNSEGVTDEEHRIFIALLVRKLRDQQVMLNYFTTLKAELARPHLYA